MNNAIIYLHSFTYCYLCRKRRNMYPILYHYTSIATLCNMLEESIVTHGTNDKARKYLKLRATHIDHLNDTSERKLFKDALYKKVCQYAEKSGGILNDSQEEQFNSLCVGIVYVISLSEHPDDLNMWRGYAGNGIGANIGLDFSKIVPFYRSPQGPAHFQMEHVYDPIKCIYCSTQNVEIDEDLVEQVYNFLVSGEGKFEDVRLMREISRCAVKMKHKAYYSEGEWRFVLSSLHTPQYTFSNGDFKPYIYFEIPLYTIRSITLGPCIKDNSSIQNIEKFIRLKLGDDFQIKYSEIPYRG